MTCSETCPASSRDFSRNAALLWLSLSILSCVALAARSSLTSADISLIAITPPPPDGASAAGHHGAGLASERPVALGVPAFRVRSIRHDWLPDRRERRRPADRQSSPEPRRFPRAA